MVWLNLLQFVFHILSYLNDEGKRVIRMKAVFLDRLTLGSDIDIAAWCKYCDLKIYESTSESEIYSKCEDCEIIITNKVKLNKEILIKLNRLKKIFITATGTNNVDLDAAAALGIEVQNVKGYATNSVVQQTLAMALYHVQSLGSYHQFIKSGEWQKSGIFTSHQYPYHEMKNLRWGIVGMGTIGMQMAQIAQLLGFQVSYFSTSGQNHIKMYDRMDNLADLLAECDIVSIHCSLNPKTYHLINTETLQNVKNNLVLINMSRGDVVKESDLVECFKRTKIKLGLDVMSKEPMENSELLKIIDSDRVIFTPHNAWASIEARETIVNTISEYLQKC